VINDVLSTRRRVESDFAVAVAGRGLFRERYGLAKIL
jgi:hypothetical protein